jgi:hypothetical protein
MSKNIKIQKEPTMVAPILAIKYRPKKIKDIIGNKKQINMIIEWLSNYEKNKKKYLENLLQKEDKQNDPYSDISKKEKKNKLKKIIKQYNIGDENSEEEYNLKDNNIENDILSNYVNYKKINLDTSKMNEKSMLLIMGYHGIGKSVMIDVILNELNYEIEYLDINKLKLMEDKKNKKDNINTNINILNKIANKNNIFDMFNGINNKKLALVIDNVDIINSNDVSLLSKIIQENEKKWTLPIIFISGNDHNKFITELSKKALNIKIYQPYDENMFSVLNKISLEENIKYSNKKVTNIIIQESQKDYRKLISTLQELKNIHNNEVITENIIDTYYNIVKKKDEDYDLFKFTGNLLYNYNGIKKNTEYYMIDKVNIPLMIHKNYIKGINTLGSDNNNNLSCQIANSLANGDIVENYIYCNQNWNIYESHCFYGCLLPSYLYNKNTNTITENIYKYGKKTDETIETKNFKLEYIEDLNKTSIKKMNKKNIKKVNKFMNNLNVNDYIKLSSLIKKLVTDNKIIECAEMFKDYNFTFENIDKIMKINKLGNSIFDITTKQKKILIKNM